MKWIGQNIYDFISRFRNDVYLEGISSGTIASGGNLGLDSNNKIVKATAADGDITGVTAGTGLSGGGTSGAVTLNVDASQTQITSLGTIGTGTWQGTAIASAYLDADTAHLSGAQTFTGGKTFTERAVIFGGNRNVDPGDGAMIHVDTCDITDSATSASGTVSAYRHVSIENPRLLATNASVTTGDAATLYVKGAPVAFTNQTITNSYALWVGNGDTRLDGDVTVNSPKIEVVNQTTSGTGQGGKIHLICNDGAAMGDDHQLGKIGFWGAEDGSGTLREGATIRAYADAAWSDTENGTRLEFYTKDGDNASELSLTLDSDLLATFAGSVTVTGTITGTLGTATQGTIDHDSLANFVANEHIDWTGSSAGTIHSSNIPTLNQDTTGEAGTVATIAGLAPNTATTQATQGNITSCANLATVGTIGTGVWQGTAVASAYLDADTMHYSAQRQLTHHTIKDDIGTGVIYISLGEIDAESGTKSNKNLPLLAPVAGKLLKVFLRTEDDMSGANLTWRLLTRAQSASTDGNAAVIGTKVAAGPTDSSMVTYDFTDLTTSGASGTNAIVAGDKVQLSVQSDAASADQLFFITCLWEWDLS